MDLKGFLSISPFIIIRCRLFEHSLIQKSDELLRKAESCFSDDAVNTVSLISLLQDRENPLDNVLLYSLRRAGSVEMLDHSGDEDDRRTSRKSSPHDASHRSILTASLHIKPTPPSPRFTRGLSLRHHHSLSLNFHTGFLHPSILSSILSSIQPTYIFTRPPWQIIPPSVLAHLRRRPALPLFILTTIPSHLLSCPAFERPALTSSSSSSSPSSSFPPSAVPRSSSNLENTERKRVKTRLKKLILKRPPLQALQEKGLIKGEDSFWSLISTQLFFVQQRAVVNDGSVFNKTTLFDAKATRLGFVRKLKIFN